ncbi:MAG: 3'-5' exonuclease domain-containing protein 2 [Muribaculaceae bacterium]|nr:3'-5' exonuclease domain-containing protein 2 [Muribaculaceae bacterium]
MYKISIEKEQINQLPVVSFDGQIIVVDSMATVNAAVSTLRRYPIVGFDTETRPSFRRGVLHKMALMQISAPDICFLFRLNKIGLPVKLKQYLEDPSCLKVGLSLHDDWNVLHRQHDVHPEGFIDVQTMVSQFHIADTSLQKLFAILFQQKISKSQQLSNWEAPTLTDAQQRYAATDAWACIKIFECLSGSIFNPDLSPYKTEILDEE